MAIINFKILDRSCARAHLGKVDAYLTEMKPIERSLKMGLSRNVSLDEFVSFTEDCVCDWTDEEREKVRNAAEKLSDCLSTYNVNELKIINIIKSNGKEEWNSAYTRGNSIILPVKKVAKYSDEKMFELLAHEFFHIYSRYNTEKRRSLYKLLEFDIAHVFSVPREIKALTLVNPDAMEVVYTEILLEEEFVTAIPLIMIDGDNVDDSKDILSSIKIKLYLFESGKLVNANDVPEFIKKLKVNIDHIQHPEETLAENFTYLMTKNRDLEYSDLLDEIERIMKA